MEVNKPQLLVSTKKNNLFREPEMKNHIQKEYTILCILEQTFVAYACPFAKFCVYRTVVLKLVV